MHLQHRFHPVESWYRLQHVSPGLLPLRHLVLALPCELYDVHDKHDLHPVRRIAACAAWRDLVCGWLPERRVRQWHCLCHVCVELPDVLWRWGRLVLHMQRNVNVAVPEREYLRGHVPGRDLRRRQQRVHRVQCQLRDVHRLGHDVRNLRAVALPRPRGPHLRLQLPGRNGA